MKKEQFEELVESVDEGFAILRGERKPARVFQYPPQGAPTDRQEIYAICVVTDDPELLQVRKLYQVHLLSDGLVSLTDEAGEAAIYPAGQFILLELPREVEEALSHVV